MNLEIQKEINRSQLSVKLSGRFDTPAANEFDREFAVLPEDVRTVELDFSAVSYISSAGLRSLLKAKKLATKRDKRFACQKY